MTDVASVVQFPHPGPEHVPTGDWMQWNTGPHRRKFMSSPGAIVDRQGNVECEKHVVFWGEWEAPSRVVRRFPPEGTLPRVLHEPCWEAPRFDGFRQNTDPWVFGDAFIYSNCKQLTPSAGRSSLQTLSVGSMILFGSVLRADFVVDTVFVVGEVVGSYSPLDFDLPASNLFRICTIESLTTGKREHATAPFTLYRGATPTEPVEGMFSFVPCLSRTVEGRRFRRPEIRLPGFVNPRSRQAPSGAKLRRPLGEVKAAWSATVDQVVGAGLRLGCSFAVPSRCP